MYITSIAAKFAFYPPFLDNADYIVGSGADTRVLWGAFAELLLIIANIGTAVALYPVVKRRFPALSLGFVTARVMESVFIAANAPPPAFEPSTHHATSASPSASGAAHFTHRLGRVQGKMAMHPIPKSAKGKT